MNDAEIDAALEASGHTATKEAFIANGFSESDARTAAMGAMVGMTPKELADRLLEAERARPTPVAPAPQAPAPAPTGSTPFDLRAAEAKQAAENARRAAQEQAELVEGARALAAEQLGHDLADGWTDQEVLEAMGLAKPSDPVELRRFEQEQRHAAMMADPAQRAKYERQQALAEFDRLYWQRGPEVRASEAAALNINLATYQPPTSFNGSR